MMGGKHFWSLALGVTRRDKVMALSREKAKMRRFYDYEARHSKLA